MNQSDYAINIERTDFKDYDSILKCDCCQKSVGFFSIADVRPYIDSPMFLCIDCLRTRDRAKRRRYGLKMNVKERTLYVVIIHSIVEHYAQINSIIDPEFLKFSSIRFVLYLNIGNCSLWWTCMTPFNHLSYICFIAL